MEDEFGRRFPINPKDYKLYEEVGEGVSATVHRALCIPLNQIVAIKVLDLEKCNNDLDGIRREVQTMSLIDHPNVLHAYCSFTANHNLWIVMPYMAGGSCLHIMKSAYPEGFEERVIATLLREVLKALVYLHGHGHIHRDVKAGNILIDSNGAVKLADFGVSACMFEAGDRQRSRNTFVGTPCWMAPEVMQQLHGYDFKADIWSFGITALELAHGHAPFSKYPPMKVLLMTLQNAPPGLDYERDRRFSKSFKEMVATCLVKDPKKRPSSEKLLKHTFFKHARSKEYLAQTILEGLPPLGVRFRTLKGKEANFLLQNQVISGDKEELSQKEYIRGISGWNFNLEDLKAQAALIQSPGHVFNSEDLENNHKLKDVVDIAPQALSSERVDHAGTTSSRKDGQQDLQDLEGPFAPVFPSHPLQALKKCFDICEDNSIAISPDSKDSWQPNPESIFPLQQSSQVDNLETRKCNGEDLGRSSSVPKNIYILGRDKISSGSLIPEHVLSPYKHIAEDAERNDFRRRYPNERNHSGPLLYRHVKDSHSLTSATPHEESSEGRVVQHKGRFKITSADSSTKVAPSTNSVVNPLGVPTGPTIKAASVLPSLQFLLQQNAMQREQLIKLFKYVEQTSGCQEEPSDVGTTDLRQLPQASGRERELQAYVVHLEQSIGKVTEELERLKFKNSQLERQVNTLSNERMKPKEKEARG